MQTPPLRPRHHPRVEGEVRRTDSDVPDDALGRRLRIGGAGERARGPQAGGAVARRVGRRIDRRLLLTIPSYAVIGGQANPYGAVYRDLLTKLPPATSC